MCFRSNLPIRALDHIMELYRSTQARPLLDDIKLEDAIPNALQPNRHSESIRQVRTHRNMYGVVSVSTAPTISQPDSHYLQTYT